MGIPQFQLASAARLLVERQRTRNVHIQYDFMMISQIVVDVGRRYLAGCDGFDDSGRSGYAVSARENAGDGCDDWPCPDSLKPPSTCC